MSNATIVDSLIAARAALQPYEPPSSSGDLDEDGAYALQKDFVTRISAADPIAGFKGAATAPPMQQRFGLSAPATGVLFASGIHGSGERLKLSSFRAVMLETEIGFRIGRTIDAPIDPADVKPAITATLPMIEFADAGFGANAFQGVDLIACNAASAHYLAGDNIDPSQDIDAIEVSISRDGERLGGGLAGAVLDSQWNAVHWLINEVVARGYTLEPGHLLMTGAIGGAYPGAPGSYRAEFGPAGILEFTLA